MDTVKTIFTIGHKPLLTTKILLQHLKRYGVNAVADIRRQPDLQDNDFGVNRLTELLRSNGIWYLSFMNEFAIVDEEAKRSDEIIYDKVIQTERFLDGIERLEKGVGKGYTIALFDDDISPVQSFRSTVVGRYLDEHGWDVHHILQDGTNLSQRMLADRIEESGMANKIRKEQSARLGMDGEEIAADYLMRHGYRILDRNWNLHRGCELDIVAFKDNTLHAVEVKTRANEDVAPEIAINREKMRHLVKAFSQYKYQHFLTKLPSQIDSISIVMKDEEKCEINMFEDLRFSITKFY